MIREYRDGAERVVANVSLRHATHGTETKARQAARRAGEHAVARMSSPSSRHLPKASRSPLPRRTA
ncbi:isochorismatase [Cupriavidus basilensis]